MTSYGVPGISLGFSGIQISGSTHVYGLIGYPVDHSLSPTIQNAAFQYTGFNAAYLAFPVQAAELRLAIQGLKSLKVSGFNVTTPHKMRVLSYLDEVDTEAAEIGSINTVTNEGNMLTGFNTDGIGALNAMQEAGIRPDGQSVLILGAGGAGRVIASVLAGRGCSLKLANRTVLNARRLARALQKKSGIKPEIIPLSKKALRNAVTQAQIILNASSMGMDGKHNPPIDKKWIRRDHCIFDIVYKPNQTKLLKDSVSTGARTITGLDMLVNQGACSFTLWTGKKAPIDKMRRAMAEKLSPDNDANR